MTTFTNHARWIVPLVALGLSVTACGPRPDDPPIEAPFIRQRGQTSPRPRPSPTPASTRRRP
jgi:hypothetical protein